MNELVLAAYLSIESAHDVEDSFMHIHSIGDLILMIFLH